MTDNELMWSNLGGENILSTPIFDVEKRKEVSDSGIKGDYYVINAGKWVSIIPVYKGEFVLVRQFRHGLGGITEEFPGGMCDEGEDPLESAYRELEEETGFKAGKMTVLGTCSPNPAIFSNEITFCLAEDLTPTNVLHLDADEVLMYETKPIEEVIGSFCKGEYTNAFMGTALALFMRETERRKS